MTDEAKTEVCLFKQKTRLARIRAAKIRGTNAYMRYKQNGLLIDSLEEVTETKAAARGLGRGGRGRCCRRRLHAALLQWEFWGRGHATTHKQGWVGVLRGAGRGDGVGWAVSGRVSAVHFGASMWSSSLLHHAAQLQHRHAWSDSLCVSRSLSPCLSLFLSLSTYTQQERVPPPTRQASRCTCHPSRTLTHDSGSCMSCPAGFGGDRGFRDGFSSKLCCLDFFFFFFNGCCCCC